jgi:nodulation protein E
MAQRRVAITGVGIVSCFGRGKEPSFSAFSRGQSGIRRIESVDASELRCQIAGEVPKAALEGAPVNADRFTRLALIAADEAASQAAMDQMEIDRARVGVLIGTGLGGCETQDTAYRRLYEQKQSRVMPTTIPYSMYNAPTSAISARWRAEGPAFSIVSACASSAHAIGLASQWVRSGLADVMLAGGADAPLTFGIIRAWESMRVLAVDNEHPQAACRPFSADRNGLVLAEGAAVLVLEEWASAIGRGQEILGEIVGFGLTSDAGHLTDPSVEGAARAIRMALEDSGPAAAQLGYINAHGTATRANDPTETRAIRQALGPRAERIPVSSTKSMHGHAMGASGAIEIASSLVALNRDLIPPTINLERPDPQCDLDYVANHPRGGRVAMFLSNSFGFGGMNAVVAVRTRFGILSS